MKLKKKFRKILIILLFIVVGVLGFFTAKHMIPKEEPVKEAKVVNEVDKYGYQLKENKPKKYKELFGELKEILKEEKVDETKYASKVAEMFIYDFYSLNDKTAKTDVGGVDFVYSGILQNFLQNAENTYYKYVESNLYNNRKQPLPVVAEISIDSVTQGEFAYGALNDPQAFVIHASWSYTDDQFSGYQRSAQLVLIHENEKLWLVELQ